jgi:protein-L-isoaspartate(D-aspartate) O-methyltransferase
MTRPTPPKRPVRPLAPDTAPDTSPTTQTARPRKFPLTIDQLHGAGEGSASTRHPARRDLLRPQQPLSHAHDITQRAAPPSGLGLDSMQVRRRMVERLCAQGLEDRRVIEALLAVPRHLFVDSALVNQAYEDTSLPIGWAQTISKPSVVARMIELLCRRPLLRGPVAKPLGRVLEIGSGCGYQAAVLSCLAQGVYSIERLRPLHDRARENLGAVRGAMRAHADVRLIFGDGHLGHAPNAPYDCIIAAAGAPQLPAAWLDQLAPGGRLVAPVEHAASGQQVLLVVDRSPAGELVYKQHEAVQFVPLKSGTH